MPISARRQDPHFGRRKFGLAVNEKNRKSFDYQPSTQNNRLKAVAFPTQRMTLKCMYEDWISSQEIEDEDNEFETVSDPEDE